ncbi:MAG: sensor histidine kinase, partial [Chloroflexota bacterium]
MHIVELRWVLFALLSVLIVVACAGVYLERRLGPRTGPYIGRTSPGLALPGQSEEVGLSLEQAPLGLLLLDQSRCCRYSNAYVRQLLGLPADHRRLPAADWVDLLAVDCKAARQQGASSGRYRSVSISVADDDRADASHRVVRWWVTPVGALDLVLLLDVTSQRRAEEASRQLVNNLSHELRTPLATLLTHLEVMDLANASPEIRARSLQILKAEAQRMTRLVNQMLEIGRLETSVEIERRPVDVLTLVERVVAQVAPQAEERGIRLSLEADTPLPTSAGDADRLQQVFLNLLDNAVKYCRPGDSVVVSLRGEAGGVRCAIQDTGPGIAAEHLPHLTSRFYRAASAEVAGSGLGLALADEILRRHESSLQIESRTEGEETGTSARFWLPASSTAAAPP